MERFTASDGAEIAYADEGEGRPIVLLHGLMAHAGFFERQRALADSFRVVRIDMRGHGQTRSDGAPPTLDTLAHDVGEIADHLELEGAVGVGWSLGAAVLWQVLAGAAADRFAGAVVVDMTPRVMNADGWTLGLSPELCDARTRAIAEDFPSFAASAGAAIFASTHGEPSQALADWAGEEFARNDARAIASLWASLVAQDFRPRLAAIRQPTLVVHGARSHLYDAETAEHLVAALANARAIRFDESGHAPHIDEADLFNQILRDFAASLPPVPHSTAIQTQTA